MRTTRAVEKNSNGKPGPGSAAVQATPELLGYGRFPAMNTEVRILTAALDAAELMGQAEDCFRDVEQHFSRFIPDSELSLLNDRQVDHVRISSEMMTLLKLCVRMHRATGGLFDPAILPVLEGAGYDRSFDQVPPTRPEGPKTAIEPHSIAEIVLEESKSVVRLPGGMRLDFGGIGKGYAVDRAGQVMSPAGDYLIDAGGDIVASGNGPGTEGWLIAVGHPTSPEEDLQQVYLHNEAIATSSIARRRWMRGTAQQHHIIDPRRGEPAQTDCLSVSVIAPTAMEADVYAKCALILGSEGGRLLLEGHNLPGFFVLADGNVESTSNWKGS